MESKSIEWMRHTHPPPRTSRSTATLFSLSASFGSIAQRTGKGARLVVVAVVVAVVAAILLLLGFLFEEDGPQSQ